MEIYGNLINRLSENKTYCKEIAVGTGMTEYDFSDRYAYEVIDVKDQKHITVRLYDHIPAGAPMSNEWTLVSNEKNPTYNMVKRGKYWYFESVFDWNEWRGYTNDTNAMLYLAQNMIDIKELEEKGRIRRLRRANVSFGVADYYYDYSF